MFLSGFSFCQRFLILIWVHVSVMFFCPFMTIPPRSAVGMIVTWFTVV